MKPKKWTDVYPHGTKEGDEEREFFISLARKPKYQWRSVSAISKESNLTKERVEEIINKYYKKGMIFQNPKNEDQWGYWERVPEMLPKAQKSISKKDQDDRIGKLSKCGKDACDDDDACNCDKADFSYTKDGQVFCVEVKSVKSAKAYIDRLKAAFAKKKLDKLEELKLQVLATNPQVMGVPVEERWHAPTTDEDIYVPIRSSYMGLLNAEAEIRTLTDEECLNAKASITDWELDM